MEELTATSAFPDAGGIVLCGGRSTRMGTSKALLPFGGETMLQRVVRLLSAVVSPIVVVAGPGQDLPELPSSILVTRDAHEGRGPLEGLCAGWKAMPAQVEVAYVTSCDVPLLTPAFVRRMLELTGDYDITAVAVNGLPHPLSAVHRRTTLKQVESMLAANQLRVTQLLERVQTRRVKPEEASSVDAGLLSLRNVNTPEDYREALRLAGFTPAPDSMLE